MDAALDPDLTVQPVPPEEERRLGVAAQLHRLAAFQIGVEDEPAGIEVLEQHHAQRGLAVRSDRGQGHGVGLVDLPGQGVVEPAPELRQRVGGRLRLEQHVAVVVAAQVRGRLTHRCSFVLPPLR